MDFTLVWDLVSSRDVLEFDCVVSRSRDLIERRPPIWDFALVPQSLSGSPFEPLRPYVECGSVSDHSLSTGPCLDSALDDLRALSYGFSHTRFWGEVSFSFVPVSVVKTQDSSSLAPRFVGFPVTALPTRE